AERDKKIDQPFHRKVSGTVPYEQRHMWLLDPEDLARLRLRQTARLDDAVDLQRQASLEEILFRMREPQVREDVAASLDVVDFRELPCHVNAAFLGGAARRLPVCCGSGPSRVSASRSPVSISSGRRGARRWPRRTARCTTAR